MWIDRTYWTVPCERFVRPNFYGDPAVWTRSETERVVFVFLIGVHDVTLSFARCLKDFNTVKHGSPESSVSRKIFSDHWNVKVAPLSGNIIWEHLSVDNESWWARALLINSLLFIFVLFLTTPTVILSSIQELEATIGEWRVTEIL